MNGYTFFKTLQMFVILALMPLAGVVIFIGCIYSQISTESEFHQRYGEAWRAEYESIHGSLAEARAKSAVSGVGLLAISGISTWLWRILRDSRRGPRLRSHEHRPHRSHLERIIIYRRNALLGIYFGLPGIFLGALLVIFRWGIFLDHANEAVLGIFVFLAGYVGIITGCAYWLKAKGWSEALVAIGLLPAGIIFIPFVRLILFASPMLLPMGLFMMSLILIVVVLTLPDKSGVGRQHKSRHRIHRSRRSDDQGF